MDSSESWKDLYFKVLSKMELPDKRLRWYFVWVERFEKFLPENPLAERTLDDVNLFLENWSDRDNIEEWQIRQASKALSIFFQQVLPQLNSEGAGKGQTGLDIALNIPLD